MVEGRVHTQGTLSAVRQLCERAASLKRLPSTYGTPERRETYCAR